MGTRRKVSASTASALSNDDSANDPKSGSDQKMIIRVRRGALRRFDQLKTKSEGLPVEIEWDRRLSDRREEPAAGGADRRTSERRQRPPFTWETADFVVVGDSPASGSTDNADGSSDPQRKS